LVRSILGHGHEVVAHEYTHERLAEMSLELGERVFERSLATLKSSGLSLRAFVPRTG